MFHRSYEIAHERLPPLAHHSESNSRDAVTAWIDEYNTDRRHSTNGMLSPVDYERTCAAQRRTQHSIDEHHGRTAA